MDVEITESPSQQDVDFLNQKINEEAKDSGSAESFAIFVRDSNGAILAGCNGFIIFGSIYTDQLWVHPDFRGKGLATQLMQQAHEYGKSKGCALAGVCSMSFQAPTFYQKLGYSIDFSREGYHKGASCVFLSMPL